MVDSIIAFPPLKAITNPKVNVEVTAASKFAICYLEGHCHFVIGVQGLMEAFSRMGLECDIATITKGIPHLAAPVF